MGRGKSMFLFDPAINRVIKSFSLSNLLYSLCVAARPEPISVPVNTRWFGMDGSWSPVNIRVGSPPQWLSVLPNTAGQETWVIGRAGCDSTFICRDKRGGLFLSNESSTWENVGFYELGFDLQLGDSGAGYYGYDSIALSEDIVVPGQTVALVNDTQYWLGYMGLGITGANFTDSNKSTFLSSLVEDQSLIPSYSYGYTAGAYYRLKGVPASLTLGGVDSNRFHHNNVSFSLSPDKLPVVALNSITVTANSSSTAGLQPNFSNPLTLLKSESDGLYTVDSSTAFLWLPEAACDAFSDALGLIYNETLEVYTYGKNSSLHDTLGSWNLTFTFTIADFPGSSNSVEIILPFSAFDHALSYPFPHLESEYTDTTYNYFPLRKAADSTQYTIGRVFLQEAYLTVDYERGNFSISQAKFSLDSSTNLSLAGIDPPQGSHSGGPDTNKASHFSVGAKVGIGVGAGSAILIILVVLAVWRLRASKKPFLNLKSKRTGPKNKWREPTELSGDKQHPVETPAELSGDKQHPVEAPADSNNTRFELSAVAPVELPCPEGMLKAFQERDVRKSGENRDLSAYDATSQKLVSVEWEGSPEDHERYDLQSISSSSLPAYSPLRIQQHRDQSQISQDESDRLSASDVCPSLSSQSASPKVSPSVPSPTTFHFSGGPSRQYSPGIPSPLNPFSTLEPTRPPGSASSGEMNMSPAQYPTAHLEGVLFPPYRTASRSSRGSRTSRFVEEGLRSSASLSIEPLREQQDTPPPHHPQLTRKFSWES